MKLRSFITNVYLPRRNKVTRELRKLLGDEPHNLLSTRYIRSDNMKRKGMEKTCSTLERCVNCSCQKSLMNTWVKIREILKLIFRK